MSRVFDNSQVTPDQTFLQALASPAYNNLGEITVSVWVYPTALLTYVSICVKDPTGQYIQSLSLFNIAGNLVFRAILGSVNSPSGKFGLSLSSYGGPYIPLNQWTHLAATFSFSGDQLTHLYINGIETTYQTQTSTTFQRDDSGGDFFIGHDLLDGDGFSGRIGEFVIYNRALTPTEVLALANSSSGASGIAPANLAAYWHLCGVSSVEPDASGNGNDAILSFNPPTRGSDTPGFVCSPPPLTPAPGTGRDILISPISVLLPGSSPLVTEENCTQVSLNFTLAGGSFSISVLKDSVVLPPKDTIITLPLGRIGVVKNLSKGFSTGGLLDVISGPAIPFVATLQTFTAIPQGTNELGQVLATRLLHSAVHWLARDFGVKNFNFRGIALQGVQQLAGNILADVIVRGDNQVYVAEAGRIVGNTFTVDKRDIVSASQTEDFNNYQKSVLNPALTEVNVIDEGTFLYDSEHAQKQPKSIVQCGAPAGTGSKDLIPIPDGWLVDGSFEEWVPTDPNDFTNPSPSVGGGRYWKVFQSPTSPGSLRGITNFNRLVKQMSIPKNVSKFVGSPITGITKTGSSKEFRLDHGQTESGIYGFTAEKVSVADVVSGQLFEIENALVLSPFGGASGEAQNHFYSLQLEFWTFPRVSPTIFPGAGVDPTNPFGIPADVVIVNPSSQILPGSDYYAYYFLQYQRIHSVKLRTTISVLYRNVLPQPGDRLIVPSLPVNDCGRIVSVNLNFARGGIVLSITAELLEATGIDPQGYSGRTV